MPQPLQYTCLCYTFYFCAYSPQLSEVFHCRFKIFKMQSQTSNSLKIIDNQECIKDDPVGLILFTLHLHSRPEWYKRWHAPLVQSTETLLRQVTCSVTRPAAVQETTCCCVWETVCHTGWFSSDFQCDERAKTPKFLPKSSPNGHQQNHYTLILVEPLHTLLLK